MRSRATARRRAVALALELAFALGLVLVALMATANAESCRQESGSLPEPLAKALGLCCRETDGGCAPEERGRLCTDEQTRWCSSVAGDVCTTESGARGSSGGGDVQRAFAPNAALLDFCASRGRSGALRPAGAPPFPSNPSAPANGAPDLADLEALAAQVVAIERALAGVSRVLKVTPSGGVVALEARELELHGEAVRLSGGAVTASAELSAEFSAPNTLVNQGRSPIAAVGSHAVCHGAAGSAEQRDEVISGNELVLVP